MRLRLRWNANSEAVEVGVSRLALILDALRGCLQQLLARPSSWPWAQRPSAPSTVNRTPEPENQYWGTTAGKRAGHH